MPCGLSKFKELKPAWVWEPTYATCLCPYCYTMRLLQLGLVRVYREAARPGNTCACAWCTARKREGVDGIAPPHHAKVIAAQRYCEKETAPEDSGFEGTYPTYRPGCFLSDLPANRRKFFESELGCVQCESCCKTHIFPSPGGECTFMDADKEVRYRRYVETPSGFKLLEYTSCSRREFAERYLKHYGTWVSHRYQVDWQDAATDCFIKNEHDPVKKLKIRPRCCVTCDQDFAMGYDCKHGDGQKDEHWTTRTIQMHTMVSYHEWEAHMVDKIDPSKHPSRRMDVDYYMSDDKHHDAHYVADNLEDCMNRWIAANQVRHIEELILISDGGPNHYKCRQNWRNLSLLVAKYAKDNVALKVHQSIRGEHHGKGVVDGFNATGKGAFRRVEKRRLHDEGRMETSHIDDAASAVRIGNASKRRKIEGQAELPLVPRKGRNYVAQNITYHETHVTDLEARRANYADTIALEGTHTHFHFYAVAENVLDIRFLTCCCHNCRAERWSQCCNRRYVGKWKRHELQKLNKVGVELRRVTRRDLSDAIANDLTGEEEAVAVFTQLGSGGQSYWLLKPTGKPWIVQNNAFECPISKEKFEVGERVIQGEWYDIVDKRQGLYEFRPDLGVFTVPTLMLRAGGGEDPIRLEKMQPRGRSSRQFYKLDGELGRRIEYLIDHVHRDNQ